MRRGDPSSNVRRTRSATNDTYEEENIALRTRRISIPGTMRSIRRPRQHIPSTLESIGCDKPPSKDEIDHDYQRKTVSIAPRKRIIGTKQSSGRLSTAQDESKKGNRIANNIPVVSPPCFRRSPMTINHAANNNNRNVESSKIIELLDDDDSFYVEKSKTLSDSEDSSILEVYSICSGDSYYTRSVDYALDDCDPQPPGSKGYCLKGGKNKNRMLDMTHQPQQYYYAINDTARDNSRPHMAAIPIVQHSNDNIGPYNGCAETFSVMGRPRTSAAATVIESRNIKKTSRRKESRVISPGEIKFFHIERRGAEKQTNHVDTARRTKEATLRINTAQGSHRSVGLDNKEIVLLDRHQSCNTSYVEHQYSHSKKTVTPKGRRHEIITEDITHSEAAKRKYRHQSSTTLAQDETIERRSMRTIHKDTHENKLLRAQTMVCSSEEEESVICDTHTGNSTMMRQGYQKRGNNTPLFVVQDDQYLPRKNRMSGQERIPDNQVWHPNGINFSSSEEDRADSSKMAERSIHMNPSHVVTNGVNCSPDELDYPTNEKKRLRINHTKLVDNLQQRKQGKKASSSNEENCIQTSDQQTTNVVHGRGRFHSYSTHSSSCTIEQKKLTRRDKKSTLKKRSHLSSGKQPVRQLEDEDVASMQNCGRSDPKFVFQRRLSNNDNRKQYSTSPDKSAIALSRTYGDEDYQPPPSSSVSVNDYSAKSSDDESYEPSPYERFRNEKVRRNQEYLASLGLHEIKDSLSIKKSSKGRKRNMISTSLEDTACSQLPKETKVGIKVSNKAASKISQEENLKCDSLVAVGDGPCKKAIEEQETVYYAHDNKARRPVTQDHMVESLSDIKQITRGIREEQMSCFFYARSGKFDQDGGFDVSRERHQHLLSNENRNTLRGATGKLQRCMQCVACLRQDDCLQCTYCRDNIRNGGTYLRKCALRRCVAPLPPRIHHKDDDVEESLEVCKNILSTTKSSSLGEALLKADVKSLFGSNLSPYRLTASNLTQNVDNSQKRAKPLRRQRGPADRPQEECELSSTVNRDEDSLSDRIVLEGFDECDDSIAASCNNLLDKDMDGTCRFIDRRKGALNQSPRFFAPQNGQKVSTSGKSGAELARSLISFQRNMLPASRDEAEAEFSGDEAFNLLVM